MQERNDFNQPVKNLQKMLQTILRSEGIEAKVIPDGIYGADTAEAVSIFQRSHAIPVTGAVDEKTWDAIAECYTQAQVMISAPCPLCIPMNNEKCYCQGDEHSNIYIVQCILQEISHTFKCITPPSVNGKMDEPTCLCIEQFQRLCELPSDGKMDMVTWKNMCLLYPVAVFCHQT